MPDMSAGLERDMPSVTPGLKDISSPKPEGGHSEPAVLLVAGLTVMAVIIITLLLLVSCVLTMVVIYFRWKKQLMA